jgi:hypothetical protein
MVIADPAETSPAMQWPAVAARTAMVAGRVDTRYDYRLLLRSGSNDTARSVDQRRARPFESRLQRLPLQLIHLK